MCSWPIGRVTTGAATERRCARPRAKTTSSAVRFTSSTTNPAACRAIACGEVALLPNPWAVVARRVGQRSDDLLQLAEGQSYLVPVGGVFARYQRSGFARYQRSGSYRLMIGSPLGRPTWFVTRHVGGHDGPAPTVAHRLDDQDWPLMPSALHLRPETTASMKPLRRAPRSTVQVRRGRQETRAKASSPARASAGTHGSRHGPRSALLPAPHPGGRIRPVHQAGRPREPGPEHHQDPDGAARSSTPPSPRAQTTPEQTSTLVSRDAGAVTSATSARSSLHRSRPGSRA
jgi:hypothetical protein